MSVDLPSYPQGGRFETIVNNVDEAVVVINERQEILWVNQALLTMFRYSTADLVGNSLHTLLPSRFCDLHPGYVRSFLDSEIPARPMYARAPVMGARSDGSEFPCEISIAKIPTPEGCEMTALIRDVSERPRLEEELEHLSSQDRLSGLMGRARFLEWLDDQLARHARFDEPFSLLLIELDHLASLAEQQGRAAADALVVALVERIRERYAPPDRLARIRDGRFALILPGAAADRARAEGEALHRLVGNFDLTLAAGEVLGLTATVGVLVVAGPGCRGARLLAGAESALDVVLRREEDCVRDLPASACG
ncbi:GGDEF domain-containing protein [Motiliproteus sp. SC1-56]|uniref:GGDEF domain-containing protein n=1 Tax=Motiliproteus sp. SC1-56 TaxID=2799565 RepID=UPI001A8D191F|nr:diguanylate cyclase [Motiliproteus sp. SC1-56]